LQQEAFRLKKERCVQARCDLIQAVNVAHEEDALQYLEEMHGHIDMLVATDEYGSTLLHEACSRGMLQLRGDRKDFFNVITAGKRRCIVLLQLVVVRLFIRP